MAYDERTAERVRKVLARRQDVVEKKLMGGLCFMVKGGMCCCVSGKGGLLVRLRADARERVLREAHVRPMEMGARTMTGFVRVAPDGYRTDAALKTQATKLEAAENKLKADVTRAMEKAQQAVERIGSQAVVATAEKESASSPR